MKKIKTIHIPFLRNKNRLCTINEWARLNRFKKTRIKNNYKELIKSWFLDSKKYKKELHFEWQPYYKDNRKRDAINIAPTIKIFEDCLKEIGSIDDDDMTSHYIKERIFDKNINDHILKLTIYERE